MSRFARRLCVGGGLAALAVGVLAAPASAHVTVNAPGAQQGGFTVLTFRVPNERDVPTTGLKVQFPTDNPLASVSVKPKAGWSYKVTSAKLPTPVEGENGTIEEAVSTIEWTATAGGIAAGEFDEFEVNGGPLPEVDTLVFKAIQIYANKEEVAWIQEPTANGEEPERPAPSLELARASAEDDSDDDGGPAGQAVGDAESTSDASASDDAASKGSVTAALVIAVLGLLAGLGGLAFGFTARRSRSGTAAP